MSSSAEWTASVFQGHFRVIKTRNRPDMGRAAIRHRLQARKDETLAILEIRVSAASAATRHSCG